MHRAHGEEGFPAQHVELELASTASADFTPPEPDADQVDLDDNDAAQRSPAPTTRTSS